MEKYRYRKKADEIKDAQNRKYSELLHRTNQDWGTPKSYVSRVRDRDAMKIRGEFNQISYPVTKFHIRFTNSLPVHTKSRQIAINSF